MSSPACGVNSLLTAIHLHRLGDSGGARLNCCGPIFASDVSAREHANQPLLAVEHWHTAQLPVAHQRMKAAGVGSVVASALASSSPP